MSTINDLKPILGDIAYGFLIYNVKIEEWGNKVTVECVTPDYMKPTRQFAFVFHGCSKFYWEPFVDEDDFHDPSADVIGYELDSTRIPEWSAIFHTQFFELGIKYESYTIEKDW